MDIYKDTSRQEQEVHVARLEPSASSLRPIISKLVSEGTVKAEGMTRNRKYMLTQDIGHTDS